MNDEEKAQKESEKFFDFIDKLKQIRLDLLELRSYSTTGECRYVLEAEDSVINAILMRESSEGRLNGDQPVQSDPCDCNDIERQEDQSEGS